MRCVGTLVRMRMTRMIVGHDADPLEPGDIHDDKDCVLFVPDPDDKTIIEQDDKKDNNDCGQ